MTWTDQIAPTLGWLAASLTLCTFACRDGPRLRVAALSANAAFVAYGLTAELLPVLALHLALIPINLWRLATSRRARPAFHETAADPSARDRGRRAVRRRWRRPAVRPCGEGVARSTARTRVRQAPASP